MTENADPSYMFGAQRVNVEPLSAGLYVVSTPIGNLGDITIRSLETLAASALIACEDTRVSGRLLNRYAINVRRVSYNEHNADQRGPAIVDQIAEGSAISLISDAGTPLVSDPGNRLVRAVLDAGHPVISVPGASAPLAALTSSGLKHQDFYFAGFLPTKMQARSERLGELAAIHANLIFFESPARIAVTLAQACELLGGDRPAVVARELTKLHETFYRGTLAKLAEEFSNMDRVRGEVVLIIGPGEVSKLLARDIDELLRMALQTMSPGKAAADVARQTGEARNDLYRRALALRSDSGDED